MCLVGLVAGGQSGVPRYAQQLIRGLDSAVPEAHNLSVRLLTAPATADRLELRHLEVVAPRLLQRATGGMTRILSEQLAAATTPADVLYFFDLTGPLLAPRRRFVATVHDATAGRRVTDRRWAYKRWLHPWAVRRASAVVAVSEFARSEAVAAYGASVERVTVIPSGPGLQHGGRSNGAPDGTGGFLYVGNFGRNKNLPLLIRAFEASRAGGPLILVGRSGEDWQHVAELAASSPRRESIQLLGGVEDAELERLFSSATAFVFPSLYEGFGFPPLEAMGRGCPVVASDIPALGETLGDAALFAPPGDQDEWARALERVEGDAALRDDLRRRGYENVRRFSWEKTATQVLALLGSLGQAQVGNASS